MKRPQPTASAPAAKSFDLFLDESGDFEAGRPGAKRKQSFQSQIAGFAAPAGTLDEASADNLLRIAFGFADQPYPDEVHGTMLRAGLGGWDHLASWEERRSAYSDLIRALVKHMRRGGLQPIRLVNREGAQLRSRADTQVAMTAALAIRAARLLQPDPNGTVAIRIHLASVALGPGPNGGRIAFDAYADALRHELALGLARHEISHAQWDITIASITSARTSRALQIADLVSHASHDGYSALNRAARLVLAEAFGAFDVSLAVPVAIEQAERSLAREAVGVALQVLAERQLAQRPTETADHATEPLLAQCLDRLAASSAETRDDQLAQVVSWLRLLVADLRNIDIALKACRWSIETIYDGLRSRLSQDSGIIWFAVAVKSWQLTAYNHAGRIAEGRAIAEAIETDLTHLAGRWEHAPVLLGSLITLAVHAIDRRDFDDAIRKADAVAGFFAGLSSLFGDALPGRFPPHVRSNLRAKALGTALQARLHRGLASPADPEEARRTSDDAIAEFGEGADRRRQYQYRCFLEATAGDFAAARYALATALESPESHGAIATAIAATSFLPRGFLLLHWLRLGAAAHRAADHAEADSFMAAFQGSGLQGDDWCLGKPESFPVHGILVHLSGLFVARGEFDAALKSLRCLVQLAAASRAPAIAVLALGALARGAAAMMLVQPTRARKLIAETPGNPHSIGAMARLIEAPLAGSPGAKAIFTDIEAILADAGQDGTPQAEMADRLSRLADRIVI